MSERVTVNSQMHTNITGSDYQYLIIEYYIYNYNSSLGVLKPQIPISSAAYLRLLPLVHKYF